MKSMNTSERIAHFLRLAEDAGSTQAERDLAAAQAERLMVKHGIDRATLPEQQVTETIHVGHLFFGGTYAQDRLMSAFAVVGALHLKAYRQKDVRGTDPLSHRRVEGQKLFVVAFESDLADALQLLGSLDLQASVAVRAWWNAEGKHRWYRSEAEKGVARRSFIGAFGRGAALRISETRKVVVQEAVAVSSGAELVLVAREERLDRHLKGIGLTGGRRSSRQFDGRAASAGQAAGYQANTGAGQRGIGARYAVGA